MIKKFSFIMMLIAAFAFVGTAFAQEPPAHGTYQEGWGMNPTNWNSYTGSYSSGLALFDPHHSNPITGNDWVVSWDGGLQYIDYAEITLELWIEMNMVQTYQYTHYQWHRLGNLAEEITFTIDGTLKSNNPLFVSLVAGDQPLDKLYFRRDVLGTADRGWINNNTARDIPITWDYRWGTGLAIGGGTATAWTPATTNQEITFLIDQPCDHWYQFRGTFNLIYHEADGYYSLTMAGCPSPSL
ncbi:MAG: hypothetical protein ACOY90_20825 [Candidatus Zhuqueibacterota bacterium]